MEQGGRLWAQVVYILFYLLPALAIGICASIMVLVTFFSAPTVTVNASKLSAVSDSAALFLSHGLDTNRCHVENIM